MHVTTTPNVTYILLIICQSYIPDKALTLASNSMTPAIMPGLLVHVKIILKVYESLMKFSRVLIILLIVIREEGCPNHYTLPLLCNCITQKT